MRRAMLTLVLLMSGVLAWGCGGEAAQGEECDEAGGEAGVCEEGSICGDEGGTLTCLKVCTDQADCASDEECNGVEGSNVKGCRKK